MSPNLLPVRPWDDSLIVASAVLGDATILYSEDMQDGLIINNSLQIINPFKDLNS